VTTFVLTNNKNTEVLRYWKGASVGWTFLDDYGLITCRMLMVSLICTKSHVNHW